MIVTKYIVKKPVILAEIKRHLFYWVQLQFNVVDEDRRKQFGPDRTCAEWILRNGGAVKWTHSSQILADYNQIPKEGTKLLLQEVDATDSSIMQNGFPHFQGCDHLIKLILHKCQYVDDRALPQLQYLKKSLLYLQISSCPNITDKALLELHSLTNLKQLMLFDLVGVKDLQKTVQALKTSLALCNIEIQ